LILPTRYPAERVLGLQSRRRAHGPIRRLPGWASTRSQSRLAERPVRVRPRGVHGAPRPCARGGSPLRGQAPTGSRAFPAPYACRHQHSLGITYVQCRRHPTRANPASADDYSNSRSTRPDTLVSRGYADFPPLGGLRRPGSSPHSCCRIGGGPRAGWRSHLCCRVHHLVACR
jgi:hypothetical protein